MTINCIAKTEGKENCPYLRVCLARLTDPTITGCGIPLYMAGVIDKSDIMVEHTVRHTEKPKLKSKAGSVKTIREKRANASKGE